MSALTNNPTQTVSLTVTYDQEQGVRISPPKEVTFTLTSALADVFARAAYIDKEDSTPLSFTSLLLAMIIGSDEFSSWLKLELERYGATIDRIVEYKSRSKERTDRARGITYTTDIQKLAASKSAREALEQAQAIAATLESPALDVRHVAAAYPVLKNWHLEDFQAWNIDRLDWCRRLGAYMAEHFPAEKPYWRDYGNRAAPVPLTSFSADIYTEEDQLGIDRTVDALALLIASTRTDTPLSIGVFGPWGSGKSFFMRHLRKRIWGLAEREQNNVDLWKQKRAAKTAKVEDAPLYYGQIAQVEFNAWHYNEGNLVASLVDHIFRNLRVTPPDKKDEQLEERRAHYLAEIRAAEKEFTTSQADIDRTKERIESARNEIKKTSEEIAAARNAVAESADKIASHTADAEAARRQFEAAIQDLSTSSALDPATIVSLAMEPVSGSAAVKEAKEAGAQFASEISDWRNFLQGLFSARGLVIVALCLAAPVTAKFVNWVDHFWANLVGIAATGTASLAHVVKFIRDRRKEYEARLAELNKAEAARITERQHKLKAEQQRVENAWTEKLNNVRKTLEQQRAAVAQREASVAKAVQRVDELTKELDGKVQARVKVEEELARLQAGLDKLSSAYLLDEFLKDRAGTNEYRKELGLLALVRRDFERLSDLIAKANDEWCSPNKQAGEAPLLNRIVLYIDDLDRCDVKTVIEVLQAVHLLLAFRLFVCVVAVDPRWIEQCLREKHGELFKAGEEGYATVGDYLEKIFQIPIWMQPVENRARAALVKKLLGTTAAPAPPKSFGEPKDDTGDEVEGQAKPEARNQTADPDSERRPLTNAFQTLVKRAEENPDPLRITPDEAAFVDRLDGLLSDRPRALKRFVNTYRLLKASLSDLDQRNFVSKDRHSPYRICLSQLAIFTSQPRIAPTLLSELQRLSDLEGDFGSWALKLNGKHQDSIRRLVTSFPELEYFELKNFCAWLPDTSRYLFHRNEGLTAVQPSSAPAQSPRPPGAIEPWTNNHSSI